MIVLQPAYNSTRHLLPRLLRMNLRPFPGKNLRGADKPSSLEFHCQLLPLPWGKPMV